MKQEIIHGDSLDKLKDIPSESVDLVCTDPPYGYSFMGKSWDKTLPDIGIFKECHRVLKAGAFAFVMSAPRSDVCARMMIMLEEAGFNIGFTPIYWTYASGFPKASNIGKMVDKRMGTPRTRVAGGVGTDEGYSGGFKAGEAQSLDGSYGGFQPKPAVEVVIVAMKPLSEKTFVDQALKNGKGITWLDDGRIPTGDNMKETKYPAGRAMSPGGGKRYTPEIVIVPDVRGRFPANLLVSDDVLNDGRITKSGEMNGKHIAPNSYGGYNTPTETQTYPDSGSYSRYFDLDKWYSMLPFIITPKAS